MLGQMMLVSIARGEPRAIEGLKDHVTSTYEAWAVEAPQYLQTFEL